MDWSIGEMKERGKAAFKANYWKCVVVAFIMSILFGGASAVSSRGSSLTQTGNSSITLETGEEFEELSEAANSVSNTFESMSPMARNISVVAIFGFILVVLIISFALKIFLFNPLEVGCYAFFKENVDEPAELGIITSGFKNYSHIFLTLLLRDIFLVLWTLLFFIPGIVKAYSYRMVPYIIEDEPGLSAQEAITRSRQMMNGNKWRTFLLDLSFLGWAILGILTCGILNLFWTMPYQRSADAALYTELKSRQ